MRILHRLAGARKKLPRVNRGHGGAGGIVRPCIERMERRLLLSTYWVTNASDAGPGSLRQAILDVNGHGAEADVIDFDIPGGGVHTISPLRDLPPLADNKIIDGYSQPGSSVNTLAQGDNAALMIDLDGHLDAATGIGLSLGDHCVVQGLTINRFGGDAVVLPPSTGSGTIRGDFIGTDPTGRVPEPNGGTGIDAQEPGSTGIDAPSPGVVIGGSTPADRNLISANAGNGLNLDTRFVSLHAVAPVLVEGNYIGTDATGELALGNGRFGARVAGVAETLSGNVISGNTSGGVWVFFGGGASLDQNLIGTNVIGAAAIPNGGDGIFIDGGPASIGGTGADSGNVISGNHDAGIEINGGLANIMGNIIGLTATSAAALPNQEGIRVASSTVQIGGTSAGNAIAGNTSNGIDFISPLFNPVWVLDNFIGTNSSGAPNLGNGGNGVVLPRVPTAQFAFGPGNVVSGNSMNGIEIPPGADANWVKGNRIGTTPDGSKALPNRLDGILISSGGNSIGGARPVDRNLISGNLDAGIRLQGASATQNSIIGNYIGTDAAGLAAVPNPVGVDLEGAMGNIIGLPGPARGNVISGNGTGVLLAAGADFNSLYSNRIGTDATGTAPLGNHGDGVLITNSSETLVGGQPDGVNTIAYNQTGVVILGNASTGNSIRLNSIYSNAALGIDLNGDAVTPNGPVITSATTLGDETTITGHLQPGVGPRLVDFYLNGAPDPSGYGQGQTYLGTMLVQLDLQGSAAFTFTIPLRLLGPWITATCSASGTNTSEFSKAVRITLDTTPPRVTAAVYDYAHLPQSLSFTFSKDVSASLSRPSGAMELMNLATNQVMFESMDSYNYATNTATYTFRGPLPDGNYRATLPASGVADSVGDHMLADYTLNFFVLAGDVNRDRSVGFDDLLIVARHYGQAGTFADGDLNGDGKIGFDDLIIVARSYGHSVPPPAAGALSPLWPSVADDAVSASLPRRRRH